MDSTSETKLKMQTNEIGNTAAGEAAKCVLEECEILDTLVQPSKNEDSTEETSKQSLLKRSTTSITTRAMSSSVTCLKSKANEAEKPETVKPTPARTTKLVPSTHSLRSNNTPLSRAATVRNSSNLTHKSSTLSTVSDVNKSANIAKPLCRSGLHPTSSKSSITMSSRINAHASRDSISKPVNKSGPLTHRGKLESNKSELNTKLDKTKVGNTTARSVANTPRTVAPKQKSFVRSSSKQVFKAPVNNDTVKSKPSENVDACKEKETEVGDDVDLENIAGKDLKELERKANICVSSCIRIMKKCGNTTSFRPVMNNIESKAVLSEKLKGVSLLVDKLCADHIEKRDSIKNLEEKLKQQNIQIVELKSKVTQLKVSQQEKTLGRNVLMSHEIEIEIRDKEIHELKKKLEDNKTVLEDYKKNHVKKCEEIRELNEQLTKSKKSCDKMQEDYNILQNEMVNVENKCNEQKNISKKTSLQEQNEELLQEIAKKNNECSEAIYKAKQYFDEMMALKQQVVQIQKAKSEAEVKAANLENELKNYMTVKTYLDNMTGNVKDLELELAKVRQSEKEKKLEIENLKIELYKSKAMIEQLEEQIERDKHLLEVRGDFINSLQDTNMDQRKRLDEMFANGTSNLQLTTELRAKETDYQTLFSTLGNKSIELSRQEQVINLLRETNERNQMLRVKQEERIGCLEDEIARLKLSIKTLEASTLIDLPVKPILTERPRKRNNNIRVRTYST